MLSGRAVALIGGREYELGPADFVAFPTPSVAHHLRNPFDEDLVYLMGGKNLAFDVADFPMLGRRLVKLRGQYSYHDMSAERPLGPRETEGVSQAEPSTSTSSS